MEEKKIKRAIKSIQKQRDEYKEVVQCSHYEEISLKYGGKVDAMEEALTILDKAMKNDGN